MHRPSPFPGSSQRVPRGLHAGGQCRWPIDGQGLCAGALKCDVTARPSTGHACLLHAAGLRPHDGFQRSRRVACSPGRALRASSGSVCTGFRAAPGLGQISSRSSGARWHVILTCLPLPGLGRWCSWSRQHALLAWHLLPGLPGKGGAEPSVRVPLSFPPCLAPLGWAQLVFMRASFLCVPTRRARLGICRQRR